jgi:hypothetical protein
LKFVEVIGSDSASLVVINFGTDPSLLVSWLIELEDRVPGGSEPESSNCGKSENVPLIGDVRVVVEGTEGGRSSAGDGEGRVVGILLAGRISEVEAALSRRVAVDGMET